MDGPFEGEIERGALVAVDGDALGPVLASLVGAVEVHEAGVVHPHLVVGVGRGAVEELQVRGPARDEAVVAGHGDVVHLGRHHAQGHGVVGAGDGKGPVGDFDALGAEVFEELGLDGIDFGRCGRGVVSCWWL